MLINLTNHPSADWSAEQYEAANRLFGQVTDIPFPSVPPEADKTTIHNLASNFASKIISIQQSSKEQITVHLMGELTFTSALVSILKSNGIKVVASTTKRDDSDNKHGGKLGFHFVRFREY